MDIGKTKASRVAHKTHATRVLNKINDVMQNIVYTDEAQFIKLKGLFNSYKNQFEKIQKLDDEIIALVSENEVETEQLKNLEDNEVFYATIAKVETCLHKGKLCLEKTDADFHKPVVVPLPTSPSKKNVKLPRVVLPTFDGNAMLWQTFWDQFDSSIHSREDLSVIDKFSYLRGLLKGSAKECIDGLALTVANYVEAINILKERFGNPQVIISAHMEWLVKIPSIRNIENVVGIRKIYDQVESCVRNLKSVGCDPENYGALLVPMLNEKLPSELRMIIARKFTGEIWKLQDMLQYFKDELLAKERCAAVSMKSQSSGRESHDHSTTSTFFSGQKILCVYCKLSHPPSRCTKITNISVRRSILRKAARCFICLKSGHISRSCESDYKCNKCLKRHHISLCSQDVNEEKFENADEKSVDETKKLLTVNRNYVLLQTALCQASRVGDEHFVLGRLLLDSGSQRTYVTNSLRRRLNLPTIRTEKTIIQTFSGINAEPKVVDVVQLRIRSRRKSSDLCVYLEALCVPDICSPLRNQNIEVVVDNYEHLKQLNLADFVENNKDMDIDLLIGLDFYYSIVSGKIKRGTGGPVAVDTNLGWVLCGSYRENGELVNSSSQLLNTTHVMVTENDSLTDVMQKFWKLDSIGVENELEVVQKFNNEITFKGNRYRVFLPLKPHHDYIPDNYQLSYSRLNSLIPQLRKNPSLLAEYDRIIKQYIADEIVEIVPSDDTGEPNKVHYIPHRAVIRENRETTKVRIVFDASAKMKNEPSLNECLYAGPCLLPKIFDILLRFRLRKIGIISDVEQAFLNIEVVEMHRNFLRFLWSADIYDEKSRILILRFTRVLFGLTCSPFLLNGTVAFHLQKHVDAGGDLSVLSKLLRDLYVDDNTTSVDNEEEGANFYEKAKYYFAQGGFNLRKWATNDENLQKFIDDQENLSTENNTSPEPKGGEGDITYAKEEFGVGTKYKKVLGINWDLSTDEFVFDVKEVASTGLSLPSTKRNILKISATFFDPLGFTCPVVLQAKLLFQEVTALKVDWDQVVEAHISEKWESFLKDLVSIELFRVERFILGTKSEKIMLIELHGFCDSSEVAYAGVVYAKMFISSGAVQVKLISGKSKVAPLKKLSIPRLELLSCLLLARLMVSVVNAVNVELKITRQVCWSDSEIALYWLKKVKKEWKPWVENRVNQIRDLIPSDAWRHVPGELNPADLATRKGPVIELMCDRWFRGPEFLNKNEQFWPIQKEFSRPQSKAAVSEMKKCASDKNTVDITMNLCLTSSEITVQKVIDMTKFDSFSKLCRVTAFVFRFLNNLKKSIEKKYNERTYDDDVTVAELEFAENLWLRHGQSTLSDHNISQLTKSLKLYRDENSLFRSKTRLSEASELKKDVKFPIVLPSFGHITKLIILDTHREVLHMKTETTLNRIRTRYWIIKGRQTVKTVLRRCVICKLVQGQPLRPRPLPNLPAYRVCSEYPFENTGLDYAGPLWVKDLYSESNQMHKSYILLLTCATTRCVHLELTPNMTESSLILALRRFFARKGYPKQIISDNCKSFKSVAVKRFTRTNHIKWIYILDRSPNWGGFYERLVKVVKDSLHKVIHNAKLNYEELNTILIEIEFMINSRPLTYLSDENMEALTPYHLLHGRNIAGSCSYNMLNRENLSENEILTKRVKYVRFLIEKYWSRFYHEYTIALRERLIYDKTKRGSTALKIGDIALIKDDKFNPRGKWKRGRVEELLTGRDNLVRGAKLSIITNDKKLTITRPLTKLIPLEVTKPNELDDENADNVDRDEISRPLRNAFVAGQLTRRMNYKS